MSFQLKRPMQPTPPWADRYPARRRRPIRLFVLSTAILLFILGLGGNSARAQDETPPYDPDAIPLPAEPILAAGGRTLYLENCAPCHGMTGGGDGPSSGGLPAPPPRFDRPAVMLEKSPARFFHTTRVGRIQNLMPPWENRLSEDQIWRTVMYAWSLHITPEEIDEGKRLYQANCASCHGADALGNADQGAPGLAGDAGLGPAYLLSNAEWLGRWLSAHPDVGSELSLEERTQIIEAVRTLSYVVPWSETIPDGDGRIDGSVIGDVAPERLDGFEVTLRAFLDGSSLGMRVAPLEAGRYRFEEVSANPDILYFVSVPFEGVTYGGEPVSFEGVEPARADIPIYPTSTEDSGVYIAQVAYIVDPQPGFLTVRQIVVLGNDGESTFVGETGADGEVSITIPIPLPAAAQEVRFDGGELGGRFVERGALLFDTEPIRPGQASHEISLSYYLPVDGTAIEIDQAFAYPVDQLSLLVVKNGEQAVEAPGLDFAQEAELDGVTYRIWQSGEIAAGAYAFQLEGLVGGAESANPAPGLDPNRQPTQALPESSIWIFGALLALALTSALVVFLRRDPGTNEGSVAGDRESLMRAIAALDDRRTLGEIGGEEWAQRRAELKAALVEQGQRGND